MKIISSVTFDVINIFNRIRNSWIINVISTFLISISSNFKKIKFFSVIMDQDQEPQQQDQFHEEENREGRRNHQPEPENMFEVDDDEIESESEEEDFDMDIDFDDFTSPSGSDFEGAYENRDPIGLRPRALYSFKPLRLIKRNYKIRHVINDFPLARSGHRVISSESHLYSLGGYNPRIALSPGHRAQCLLFQELWSYNFASNQWKLRLNAENATHMPTELASNALAIHNNALISHGGTGFPFGQSCSNDCYVYSTGEKALVARLEVTGDLPTAQYGPGIVIHKDFLYTIGGTTGFDYSCDVYRLNLKTKVWESVYLCRPEMRDDPEGRYRHEVVCDGEYIYVLGGGTSNSVYDLQKIPAFHLELNRWHYFQTLPDPSLVSFGQDAGFPKPRKCFSCVQHTSSTGDIEAFITGGLQGDLTTYFSDIWRLNLRTKQWHCIHTAKLPKPLYFHSAAHSGNGCMYIFGGIEYNGKEMRRRNDLFKMWMTIPKLTEMCWDALTYYNDNLYGYNRSLLLKVGIPERFIKRLSPYPRSPCRMESSESSSPDAFCNLCTQSESDPTYNNRYNS